MLWVLGFIGLVIVKGVEGLENGNVTDMQFVGGRGFYNRPLMVGLTLINGAAAKGAGTLSFHVPLCIHCSSLFALIHRYYYVLLHSVLFLFL